MTRPPPPSNLRAMRRLIIALAATLLACAYVLPPTWRAFRIEADDAPPAITRALDAQQLGVDRWDQDNNEITTDWMLLNDGMHQSRERYVVKWDRNEADGTLTVYVRHEGQDRDAAVGGDWNPVFHDADKESALIDEITKEIEAQAAGAP